MHTALTRQSRPVYEWSLDHPASAWHVEPISDTIPADLDPDIAPAMISVPLHIRLAATRPSRLEHARATMLGMTAATLIAALAVLTVTAAAIRLPAIEQQLADAARI